MAKRNGVCIDCNADWTEVVRGGRMSVRCPSCRVERRRLPRGRRWGTKGAHYDALECLRCGWVWPKRVARGGYRPRLCPPCEVEHLWCSACETVKPRDRFRLRRESRTGRSPECRACAAARRSEWKARTDYHRVDNMRRYRMTLDDYEAIHAAQSGRCAICLAPQERLCVDHDHATGAVRGLLCRPCNQGIGQLQDSPVILEAAIRYLERHR